MLLDMPNAALKCNSGYGEISAFKSVPAEVSLCITIKITQEEYDAIGSNFTILGMPNGTSFFYLYKRTSSYMPGFTWAYKNANLAEEPSFEVKAAYYNSVMSSITDGKPHCLVCCVGNRTKESSISTYSDKGLKFFLDGKPINDLIAGRNKQFLNEPTSYVTSNSFRLGLQYPNYTLTGGIYSNIKYFNFDISATGAAYSLEDYQSNRDIPEAISGNVLLNLQNNISGSTWTDDSGNANNMTLSGDYEITDE